jgi:hypothetical protein
MIPTGQVAVESVVIIKVAAFYKHQFDLPHGVKDLSREQRNSVIQSSDRVFLFRQNRERGIFASGFTSAECHQDTPGKTTGETGSSSVSIGTVGDHLKIR